MSNAIRTQAGAYFQSGVAGIKYLLAHGAGVAALGKAVVDLASRDLGSVVLDVSVAAAAFGLNSKPGASS